MQLRNFHDPLPGSISKAHTTTAVDLPLAARLEGCGLFRMGERYFVEREGLDNALLILTTRGRGVVESVCADGRRSTFEAPPGTAFLLDCRRKHRYATAQGAERTWEFLWVHFRGEYVQPLVDRVAGEGFVLSAAERGLLERRMTEALDLAGRISRNVDLRLAGLVYALLAQLVEAQSRSVPAAHAPEEDVPAGERSRDIVAEAVRILQQEYAEKTSVEELSARLHVSASHLSRLFRKAHGIGPYRYLSTLRINQAKRLLALEDSTVEEAARACGFCSTSNFIREFRRIDGETPLQYRRRARA
jgi:AraC-like DNA-binding protein